MGAGEQACVVERKSSEAGQWTGDKPGLRQEDWEYKSTVLHVDVSP